MQVKNIGQRGWWINGKLIAPNNVEEVEATEADIAGNDELEIVVEKAKPGRPAKVEAKEEE